MAQAQSGLRLSAKRKGSSRTRNQARHSRAAPAFKVGAGERRPPHLAVAPHVACPPRRRKRDAGPLVVNPPKDGHGRGKNRKDGERELDGLLEGRHGIVRRERGRAPHGAKEDQQHEDPAADAFAREPERRLGHRTEELDEARGQRSKPELLR